MHIAALVMVATALREWLCLFTVIGIVIIVTTRVRRGMEKNVDDGDDDDDDDDDDDGGISNNKQCGPFSVGDGHHLPHLS